MTEMKTSSMALVGRALDWAVASAEAMSSYWDKGQLMVLCDDGGRPLPHFSTDWAQGGPLVDKYGIEFKWVTDASIEAYSYAMSENNALGGTHLEAACRLIAMGLGETVQVPEELVA